MHLNHRYNFDTIKTFRNFQVFIVSQLADGGLGKCPKIYTLYSTFLDINLNGPLAIVFYK